MRNRPVSKIYNGKILTPYRKMSDATVLIGGYTIVAVSRIEIEIELDHVIRSPLHYKCGETWKFLLND